MDRLKYTEPQSQTMEDGIKQYTVSTLNPNLDH